MNHTSTTKNNQRTGFTLIEVLVAVFIFLMIMLAVVTVFTREIEAYRNAKQTQRSLENAQFAMSFVAKALRTSIIVVPREGDVVGQISEVYAYDFSQGACFHFDFNGDTLSMRKSVFASNQYRSCSERRSDFGPPIDLTTGVVEGAFYGEPSRKQQKSDNGTITQYAQMGHMTIAMSAKPPAAFAQRAGAAKPVFIQTTVSLRDYENAGLRQ